jgi:lysophospholipase L1-like esterase
MRWKSGTRLTIVLCILFAVGLHPTTQPQSAAQTEQMYLALGDSIPAGLLASLPTERGFPALLRDLMESERLASEAPANVDLINLAEPGETIETFRDEGQLSDALSEIEAASNGHLQTVTLTIGGNNILSLWEATADEREAELERFRTAYAEVINDLASALDEHDADVVVTTYYDLTDGDPEVEGSNAWWLRQFNEVIANTAQEAGFTVADIASTFRGQISEFTWFPADIHPNNAGHRAIARAIWQELSYDSAPPEVEITRPDRNEVRNRVPTIHATVTDNVELDSVVLQVDGETVNELIYVANRASWIGLWDARDFPATEVEITVLATDVSGNEGSDSMTITLPLR